MHQMRHKEAHDAVSSFLTECGIPFNVTRYPAWHDMWNAARKAGPSLSSLKRGLIRDLVYIFSNKQLMQRQAQLIKKWQHDALVPWQ